MQPSETKIYIVILVGALTIITLLVFFVGSIMRYQRRKLLSYEAKLQTEVEVLEQERRRIALDLHDELGSILSSVKYYLHCIELDTPNRLILQKAEQHIDNSLEHMRSICRNLLPPMLEDKGLLAVFRAFVDSWNKEKCLPLKYSCLVSAFEIGHQRTIHVYRIVQEILNNVLKHAKATEVNMELDVKKNQLEICIRDNGVGFNKKDNTTISRGLGLHNILARMDLLKGSLYLETEPGKGTCYTLNIPVKAT
jgi:signal transduction histidine kinase